MNASRINFSNKNTPFVSFGKHYVTADIGTSSEEASLKMRIQTTGGEVIATEKTTVLDNGKKRDEDNFELNIAKKIADFDKRHRNEVISRSKPGEPYEPIVTICYSGPSVMGTDKNGRLYEGHLLANIKYNHGPDIGASFKNPIGKDSTIARLRTNGLNVHKYIQANDMDASCTFVLEYLEKKRPELLKEGNVILYLYPGGGLGSGLIMVGKDRYIKTGAVNSALLEQLKGGSIARKDRSSHGLIENFSEELGIDPKIFEGNAKVVTDYDEFKSVFSKKKQGCLFEKDAYTRASIAAIDKHLDALAATICIQMCDGKTGTVVLMGPMVNGIKNAVNEYINKGYLKEKFSDAKDFDDILKDKVYARANNIGARLAGLDLNIAVLEAQDNTKYAHRLHDAVQIGTPAKWFEFKRS